MTNCMRCSRVCDAFISKAVGVELSYPQSYAIAENGKLTDIKLKLDLCTPTGEHAVQISPYIFNIVQSTNSSPTCLVWFSEQHIKNLKVFINMETSVLSLIWSWGWETRLKRGRWGSEGVDQSRAPKALSWLSSGEQFDWRISVYLCVFVCPRWNAFACQQVVYLKTCVCAGTLHACVFLRSPGPQGD